MKTTFVMKLFFTILAVFRLVVPMTPLYCFSASQK
ncbi:hypothetical protein A5814_002769 [Enterococcus faecium]|nr:hypothetical protein A5814_002769 [Enterococcus faecium]